jgi:hypothetical protein
MLDKLKLGDVPAWLDQFAIEVCSHGLSVVTPKLSIRRR